MSSRGHVRPSNSGSCRAPSHGNSILGLPLPPALRDASDSSRSPQGAISRAINALSRFAHTEPSPRTRREDGRSDGPSVLRELHRNHSMESLPSPQQSEQAQHYRWAASSESLPQHRPSESGAAASSNRAVQSILRASHCESEPAELLHNLLTYSPMDAHPPASSLLNGFDLSCVSDDLRALDAAHGGDPAEMPAVAENEVRAMLGCRGHIAPVSAHTSRAQGLVEAFCLVAAYSIAVARYSRVLAELLEEHHGYMCKVRRRWMAGGRPGSVSRELTRCV